MTYEPGKYPKEYNPKVHGPYHPGRYYGKRLGEIQYCYAIAGVEPHTAVVKSTPLCYHCFAYRTVIEPNAEVPLGDVKIGDLGGWISRRKLNPSAMWGNLHRAYWRWSGRWLNVKSPGFAPAAQIIMLASTYYFFALYKERSYHKHCKYH